MVRLTLSILLLAVVSGCATQITPPAQLQDPVTIYVTDEHIHSSVLLPVGGDRYMEYAKGDWNYAAMGNHWPWDVVGALFFSQQAALGRRVVHVSPGQRVEKLPDAKLNPLQVERRDVERLLVELEMRYLKGSDLRMNENTGLSFRRVPEAYSLINNCNSMTKRSLRELGCKVESRSPFAMYRVDLVHPTLAEPAPTVYVRGAAQEGRAQDR